MASYTVEVATWDELLGLLQGRLVMLKTWTVLCFDLLGRFVLSVHELLLGALLVEVLDWRAEVELLGGLGVDVRISMR